MEFEPMLTPREKSPIPENFPRGGSDRTRDAVDSEPKHYQQAIPSPSAGCIALQPTGPTLYPFSPRPILGDVSLVHISLKG